MRKAKFLSPLESESVEALATVKTISIFLTMTPGQACQVILKRPLSPRHHRVVPLSVTL